MTTYKRLRVSLTGPEAAGVAPLFVRLATSQDGMTAAIVTMAALDTPAPRAAELIGRTGPELDALVTIFHAEVSRLLNAERERRQDGAAA